MTAAPATTEAVLHAAIAAGDHSAYAPLEDYYHEAGNAAAARAAGLLGSLGRWPIRCEMMTHPRCSLVVLGRPRVLGDYLLSEDRYHLGRLPLLIFGRLAGSDDPLDDGGDAEYLKLAAGRRGPVRTAYWAYFITVTQALEHLGRALEGSP